MVAALGLAGLAGFGAHALTSRGVTGRRVLTALSVLFILESTGAPIGLDNVTPNPGWGVPGTVRFGDETPDVYRFVSGLPAGASLLEFPFGVSAWDEQYVFYQRASSAHRERYSGRFPSE
jgi:hypothetical protein